MEKIYDMLIVGGGASGLAAAVTAAEKGLSVALLEKNHVPGRKILSTGAGKCNFSNASVSEPDYNPAAAAFIKTAYAICPPSSVTDFFSGLGLEYVEKEKGRLYPRSMNAKDVADVLMNRLDSFHAEQLLLTRAAGIKKTGDIFYADAVKVPPQWDKKKMPEEKFLFRARTVLISTGGPCYPQIGGCGAGYDILRSFGHNIIAPVPVIVPLDVSERFITDLNGVRTEAEIKLFRSGEFIYKDMGEILFTRHGLSGPVILDMSRTVLRETAERAEFTVELDFFPEQSPDELADSLLSRKKIFSGLKATDYITGLHNRKLMSAACSLCGIDLNSEVSHIKDSAVKGLAGALKAMRFTVTGGRGFDEAVVASGGADLEEFDPRTMESKLVPGLYASGDVLNVDGRCGGFNLHFAWASGIISAVSAARSVR